MRVMEEYSHEERGGRPLYNMRTCTDNGMYLNCICYCTPQFDVNVGVLYCSPASPVFVCCSDDGFIIYSISIG